MAAYRSRGGICNGGWAASYRTNKCNRLLHRESGPALVRREGGGVPSPLRHGAWRAWRAWRAWSPRRPCTAQKQPVTVRLAPPHMEELLKRLRKHRTLWLLGLASVSVGLLRVIQSYRIRSPHHRIPILTHYDYIVVGAGAAGCAVRSPSRRRAHWAFPS